VRPGGGDGLFDEEDEGARDPHSRARLAERPLSVQNVGWNGSGYRASPPIQRRRQSSDASMKNDGGILMAPRIRYLSILCDEPVDLAGFYRGQFGLEELSRSPQGDVSLTDGGFNLTLFKNRSELNEPHMERGLHHLGVAVEDVEAVVKRYRDLYPRGTIVSESGDLHHGEVRIYDPECHPVSLSQKNFGLAANSERRLPRISHMALNALDPESILGFYEGVFGFRELFDAHAESRKRPGYRNKHVGDGFSNVAIQAFYGEEEGHEARFGIAHFGFLVRDSKAMAENVGRNGATIKARPAVRTQSEARMRDPEGNGCDLSQRGWEVDTGKWTRVEN
jgi:catechol 2,3-dioxygenase-like lactoylglutathione lyase family enzyme